MVCPQVVEPEQITVDEESSSAAATALVPATTSSTSYTTQSAAAVPDKVKWWGEVAREAYAAVDGCLEGFDELPGAQSQADEDQTGLSGPEADMVQVCWQTYVYKSQTVSLLDLNVWNGCYCKP